MSDRLRLDKLPFLSARDLAGLPPLDPRLTHCGICGAELAWAWDGHRCPSDACEAGPHSPMRLRKLQELRRKHGVIE